jgi:hypothetical protein
MPIVVAAAMYGTLLSAPDAKDLDVPSQLAVRDRTHDGRIRLQADVPRSTTPEGHRHFPAEESRT